MNNQKKEYRDLGPKEVVEPVDETRFKDWSVWRSVLEEDLRWAIGKTAGSFLRFKFRRPITPAQEAIDPNTTEGTLKAMKLNNAPEPAGCGDCMTTEEVIKTLASRLEQAERERDEVREQADFWKHNCNAILLQAKQVGCSEIDVTLECGSVNRVLRNDMADTLKARVAGLEKDGVFARLEIRDRDGVIGRDYARDNFESACKNTPHFKSVNLERADDGNYKSNNTQSAFVAFTLGMRCYERILRLLQARQALGEKEGG